MAVSAKPASYADALALAVEIRQRQSAADPSAVVQSMSDHMIATRERSAAMAKAGIKALWRTVDPYNEAQVREFARRAAKLMAVAQIASARAAAAGQVAQLAAIGIHASPAPSTPINVRAPTISIKRGKIILDNASTTVDYGAGRDAHVPSADKTTEAVFQRPAAVYRFQASRGSPTAESDANQRIDDLVDSNLMLSQRLAQQEVLAQVIDLDKKRGPKIIGYRRVIHPEMSKGGTCGMCIAASHRLYKVGELMPIHDNCACTIAPVTKDHDPADDLNTKDLDLYEHAGGNTAAHLKRTRYQIDEHGELGPVLVPKKPYKPRSAAAGKRAPKATAKPESATDVAKRNLPAFQKQLAKMLADGVPEGSPKVAYMRRMIDRFSASA